MAIRRDARYYGPRCRAADSPRRISFAAIAAPKVPIVRGPTSKRSKGPELGWLVASEARRRVLALGRKDQLA